MTPPLSDEQKRKIVHLRRARTPWKVVMREVKCTFAQALYTWRCATDPAYVPGGKRMQQVLRTQRIRRAVRAIEQGREWDGRLSLEEAHEVIARLAFQRARDRGGIEA